MKKNGMLKRGEWFAGACAVLLIALLFATGILDQGNVFEDLQKNGMRFERGSTRFELAQGDVYGRQNDGPFLMLPAGEYRLKWQLDGDGDNIIHLGSTNGAQVEPAQIRTKAGEWQGEASFTILDDAHNFNIYLEFASGTWMEIYDMRLYTPEVRDNTFTAAFVILAAYAGMLLWRRGFFTPQRRAGLAAVAVALLAVSAPFLRSVHGMHDDTVFHGTRLLNLADAIGGLQLPGRVGGFSYNGYGAATSVFYPDLFLYPGALLILGGASLTYAMNMTCLMINLLSAATMALCAGRMLGRETSACAAVLYLCAPYRLTCVLSRGATGEALAMAVLPLFILGLWEVIFGDRERWPLLGVSAMLMLMTHILSTAVCAVMAVGAGVLFLPRIIREKRLLPIIKAAAAAILLSAFFLIPMLDYSRQGIGAQAIQGIAADSALEISDLFGSFDLGIPLLLGAAAALMTQAKDKKTKTALRLCLLAGAGAALMTTKLFPWGHAAVLSGRLTDYLQFPWRLESVATVMLALAGGYGLMAAGENRKNEMLLLALAASLFCAMPIIRADGVGGGIRVGEITSPYTVHREYQIPGTDESNTRNRSVLTEGEAQVTAYEKKGVRITAQVQAKENAKLTLPLFGFDGYKAQLGGKKLELARGENNRLTVLLPDGAQGELRVWFAGKTSWRFADAASLLCAFALAAHALQKKRRRQ